jgi:hypothetical protein
MGGFIFGLTTESLILWKQRIKERIKSGMSGSEWCRKNGNENSFYAHTFQLLYN